MQGKCVSVRQHTHWRLWVWD